MSATATAAPAMDVEGAHALSRARMNVIFGTIMLGMLMSALDATIVSTALPTIVGELGGAGHMSWVVTSYLLAETISTVLAGKFGDQFGRKRLFQSSVLIFVVGSFCCGLANDMTLLILMRAVQGIGGGGIMVTATALIGEVIPLRERGRYQGALGAVFGVTTVIGPLLGGLFTDHLTWRWAFYVNVPLAILVIALAARTIPGARDRSRPKIDYLGVLFVGLGASGLTLATSWGGTQYPWASVTIIGLFAGSVAALLIFVLVERRAAEPILPMRLFRSRVFSTASLLSFIVGFCMLGALTFLPSYLQYVQGSSATMSGIRMLPMVVGLLLTSMASGQIVGQTGIYKPFPIAGTIVTGGGLYLLSRMNEHTSVLVQSLSILVLGAGVGLSMQVLTLVVQNTVDYHDLGSATSGVSFFRTLGGSFGASIMGTIFANRLAGVLPAALATADVQPSVVASPAALHALPEAARSPIVHAYAETLQTVFLGVVPVAIFGLLIAVILPQVAMRGTARELARDTGEGFAMPSEPTSGGQLETVVGRVMRRTRDPLAEVLRRSGLDIDLPTAWGLLNVHLPGAVFDTRPRQELVEDRLKIPRGVLTTFFDDLVAAGYVVRAHDGLELTSSGRSAVAALTEGWTSWLVEQVADWMGRPEVAAKKPRVDVDLRDEEFRQAVTRIARRVMREQQGVPVAA